MAVQEILAEVVAADLNEAKRVAIPLYGSLAAGGTVSDTYKVPGQYKLAIMRIRPHVVLGTMASEALAIGNVNALHSFSERVLVKAMNCRVLLTNQDTQIPILGENHNLNLGTLYGAGGQEPLVFEPAPHIVLPGQTLRMEATLVDSTAAVVGQSTEYGVVLEGLLVRTKGDR